MVTTILFPSIIGALGALVIINLPTDLLRVLTVAVPMVGVSYLFVNLFI